MSEGWRAPYLAPGRVEWLILSRRGRTLTRVALAADSAVLVLCAVIELSLVIQPRDTTGLIVFPMFAVVFLTQLFLILGVPARVAARLDTPYSRSFRQNDFSAFFFGLLGPRLPFLVRAAEATLMLGAVANLALSSPGQHQRPHQCDLGSSTICVTSSPPATVIPMLAGICLFASLHFIVFLGFVIEQRRAARK